MAKRKSLAILFHLSFEEATGAVNYFINMVRVLSILEDKRKPHVIILHTVKAPVDKIMEIGYPYIEFVNIEKRLALTFLQRLINKLSRSIGRKNIYRNDFYNIEADSLLDFYYSQYIPIHYRKRFCWICDFQHRYLPDNFSAASYAWNEDAITAIVDQKIDVLLSSYDAERDFDKFYYKHQNRKKILHFATQLPESFNNYKSNNQYLNKKYFIVSNQFWPHKNHLVVVKAVAELKSKGIEVLVLFTGHLSDRDPAYAGKIRKCIADNGLEENIKFLGFLDRLEQLALLKHSIAIVQPTFFEGWSTLVEDSIALNKFIILSELRVNQEQIKENCCFFDPNDAQMLGEILLDIWYNPPVVKAVNHQQRIIDYANNLLDVFELDNDN